MLVFEEKAFEAISDWYLKWSQIPKYIATVSFAAIAFAITLVKMVGVDKLKNSVGLLKATFVLFSTSALCASAGIFLAYVSFDLGMRVHLTDTLIPLSIRSPQRDTKWIGIIGRWSWISTLVSILLLLIGVYFLIIFSLQQFK